MWMKWPRVMMQVEGQDDTSVGMSGSVPEMNDTET